MKFHPLSKYVPILPGPELNELADDIRENGLKEPITLFEKKILDGRNRYLACKRAKVKPEFRELDNEDALSFVISKNIARRHLTPSQKAMAIAKLVAAGAGWKTTPGPTAKGEITARAVISGKKAAKIVGVSQDTVERAKEVLERAPDKADEVIAGKKTVKRAVREIKAEKKAEMVVVDALGYPVPEPALPYWNRAQEVKDLLKQISKLKCLIEELQQRQDPLYCEVNLTSERLSLEGLYQSFKGALPYAVCTSCQGQLPDTCTLCKGRGVISQFRYENALPREIKAMREMDIKTLSEK